ncbi:hypothetical protein [Sphingopyxis sp. LC81]|uniref:hypothetical protein n=1 Tax=Sphingopyxis sp. LC81 TaxID=1502850 RepID=UPI000B123B7C|nr:hypothetical protein [Sphingopyxis sp. LC81]
MDKVRTEAVAAISRYDDIPIAALLAISALRACRAGSRQSGNDASRSNAADRCLPAQVNKVAH